MRKRPMAGPTPTIPSCAACCRADDLSVIRQAEACGVWDWHHSRAASAAGRSAARPSRATRRGTHRRLLRLHVHPPGIPLRQKLPELLVGFPLGAVDRLVDIRPLPVRVPAGVDPDAPGVLSAPDELTRPSRPPAAGEALPDGTRRGPSGSKCRRRGRSRHPSRPTWILRLRRGLAPAAPLRMTALGSMPRHTPAHKCRAGPSHPRRARSQAVVVRRSNFTTEGQGFEP